MDVEPYAAGHITHRERHHAAGTFLASGRITAEAPLVQTGVAAHTITPIDVGRAHPALAELVGAR